MNLDGFNNFFYELATIRRESVQLYVVNIPSRGAALEFWCTKRPEIGNQQTPLIPRYINENIVNIPIKSFKK